MSNDLLFSVIQRRGVVPVKSPSGVTPVAKDASSERVNEKSHEKQSEEEFADQEAMQKRHGKVIDDSNNVPDTGDDGHLDTYV